MKSNRSHVRWYLFASPIIGLVICSVILQAQSKAFDIVLESNAFRLWGDRGFRDTVLTTLSRESEVEILSTIRNLGQRVARDIRVSYSCYSDSVGVRILVGRSPQIVDSLAPGAAVVTKALLTIESSFAPDVVQILANIESEGSGTPYRRAILFKLIPFRETLLQRAQKSLDDMQYEAAISTFKNVPELDADTSTLWRLGSTELILGDTTSCITHFRQAALLGHGPSAQWLKESHKARAVTVATYHALAASPFTGFASPIGVGIVRSPVGGPHSERIAEAIYRVLKNSTKVKNQFSLFPLATLKTMKEFKGDAVYDQKKAKDLSGYPTKKGIQFLLVVKEEKGGGFSATVVRLTDGMETLGQQTFLPSEFASPYDDLTRMMISREVPQYKKEEKF